jgi:alkanesulfonate monooxygenase SsuD/methylene tetrahydromethanopterin reductase-like flavin-dependent oxidoreductase (luciferase family)
MRPFRFGVVATPQDAAGWRATARRVAELGFATLLVPDGLQLLSPVPSLATAAAVADLRVGTMVLAGPLRPPRAAAWEGHSLAVLTDGRFEFGIGTGLPRVAGWARELGLPYGDADRRLADVAAAVEHLHELDRARDPHARTPVVMAAGGPKARALAARIADTVHLAAPAHRSREQVAAMATDVRERAEGRDVELSLNLFAVGDGELPAWSREILGSDPETLRAADSLALLPGSDPRAMADELCRRRDALGVSYVSVGAAYLEQMAPVVELLAGR